MSRLSVSAPIMIAFLLGSVDCRAESATSETLGPPILPANTPVILRLTKSLYKKDAKPGQPVEFEVGYDVLVNGQVFIQSGAPVTGSVRQVDHAAKGPPKVLIDLGPAQTVSGEMVRLRWTRTATASEQPGVADAVSWGAEAWPILPVFVVMSLFEKKVLLDTHAGCGWFGLVGGCGVWVVPHVAENVALDPAKLMAAQAQLRESVRQKRLPESSTDERTLSSLVLLAAFSEAEFKAKLLRQAGDLDAAIEVYQQVLALKLDSPGSRESVPAFSSAPLHFGLAELFREKRDFVHAISECRTAVQLHPNDEHTREGFMTCLVESDDLDAALAEIKEAMGIWHENIYFHYLLARLLVKRNDPDAAIVELQLALKKWKNHSSQTNCELGRALELKGDFRAALGQYRTAFRVHVNDEQCRAAYEHLRLQLKK